MECDLSFAPTPLVGWEAKLRMALLISNRLGKKHYPPSALGFPAGITEALQRAGNGAPVPQGFVPWRGGCAVPTGLAPEEVALQCSPV